MLTKDGGSWWAECDRCGYVEELQADNFQDSVDELKEEGWTLTKERGDFSHFCCGV